jgi:hypothetical protein
LQLLINAEDVRDSDEPNVPPYDANYDANYDEAPEMVACPAHTTETKLVTKIDLHVIPFLCIMYLLVRNVTQLHSICADIVFQTFRHS